METLSWLLNDGLSLLNAAIFQFNAYILAPVEKLPYNHRVRQRNLDLARILQRRYKVPLEISMEILSHVPEARLLISEVVLPSARVIHQAERTILLTPPLSRPQIIRLSGIDISITAHDQGHCDDPARGNWTWFDAAIVSVPEVVNTDENPESTANHDSSTSEGGIRQRRARTKLMENIQARYQATMHNTHAPIEIIQELRAGDMIEVIACAQYMGWLNYVDQATMRVWNVDDLVSEVE
ncbi:hypothetical protein MMC25_002691 [Agyrium rufum]|nr:hypothetical protein [Agyrium rufum]